MSIYAEFDRAFNLDELKKGIETLKAMNRGEKREYKDVPYGDYEVEISKLELVKSKKGDPMLSIWYTVIYGDYEGCKIFQNNLVKLDWQMQRALDFLETLGTGVKIEFVSFEQFGDMLEDIKAECDDKYQYGLKYTEGRKGFPDFEITEIFEI